MRKVNKTIALPIYYSLYHDKNMTVNTLLYAQLLYQIISLQNIIMSKKRTFLVPVTVSCARIPGVFIDNRV
jgi:hypothetical protein